MGWQLNPAPLHQLMLFSELLQGEVAMGLLPGLVHKVSDQNCVVSSPDRKGSTQLVARTPQFMVELEVNDSMTEGQLKTSVPG